MKSVRTVRKLFNQGRRNNDRPAASVPEYDPGRQSGGVRPAVLLSLSTSTPSRLAR